MTDARLWIIAADLMGLDPEDHENDDAIEPTFKMIKEIAQLNSRKEQL